MDNDKKRSEIAAKVAKILSEYPSHPPMRGSEYGINEVSVNKMVNLIDNLLSLREQELWDKIEKMKRKVPSAGDYPGPEAINIGSRMGYNFACSDIQTLLKSNLKGGVDCENMI